MGGGPNLITFLTPSLRNHVHNVSLSDDTSDFYSPLFKTLKSKVGSPTHYAGDTHAHLTDRESHTKVSRQLDGQKGYDSRPVNLSQRGSAQQEDDLEEL